MWLWAFSHYTISFGGSVYFLANSGTLFGENWLIFCGKFWLILFYHLHLIDRTLIETFLRTGNANVSQKYFLSLQDSAIRYADKIMAVLRKYEYDPELMKLYVCGGGVSIMKHFSEIEDQDVVYIDDICAGAKGYEHIAVKLAKRVSA